jgi:hypothetical protein
VTGSQWGPGSEMNERLQGESHKPNKSYWITYGNDPKTPPIMYIRSFIYRKTVGENQASYKTRLSGR